MTTKNAPITPTKEIFSGEIILGAITDISQPETKVIIGAKANTAPSKYSPLAVMRLANWA